MFKVTTSLFNKLVTFRPTAEWETSLDDRINIEIGDKDVPWELNRVYLIADEGKKYVGFYNKNNILETHELGVQMP